MNERIQELVKQATEEVMRNTPSFLVTNEMWKEKFAELIVRECANLAMNQRHSTSPDDYDEMNPYRQGCDDMASFISGLIRRAFGVEE